MKRYLFIGLAVFAAGCATVAGNYNQGIQGKTVWVEGNRMPGTETELPAPAPVSRWVLITPEMDMSTLPDLVNGLYPYLPTSVIDSVESDKSGKFRIGLPEGTYSVFTREEGGYFANSFENGKVNPVEVSENTYSGLTLEINYKAVY